jgi:hypothetical protein
MRTVKLLLLIVLILLVGCSLSKTASEKQGIPLKTPKDFGFVLSYGIGAKNKLDTFKGQFTKDLAAAGTTTTRLKLTNDEMEKIYQHMVEINIFNYPEVFKPSSNLAQYVTPHPTYEFTINIDKVTKKIYWEDENQSDSADAKRLRDLIDNIRQTVESKVEYKKLPPMEGGYD